MVMGNLNMVEFSFAFYTLLFTGACYDMGMGCITVYFDLSYLLKPTEYLNNFFFFGKHGDSYMQESTGGCCEG